jgi:hypothetical protein
MEPGTHLSILTFKQHQAGRTRAAAEVECVA